MTARLAAAGVAAAAVMALAALPSTAAADVPGGQCSPRTAPRLVASGTWTPSSFTLAGHRDRPRFGRDRWTDITVAGRTYLDVGPAITIRRRIAAGTLASVRFRGSGGLADFTCQFRLARAR